MAYSNAHIYLRFGGHFGSTDVASTAFDEWSSGLRLGIVGADVPYSESALQTLVNNAWSAMVTAHATSGVAAGSNCYFGWVTGARVGLDGKYNPDDQETIRKDSVPPFPGIGTGTHPLGTSNVVSLRTDRPRGRGSNGRFYYPMVAAQLAIDGRAQQSQMTARMNAFQTAFNAINTAAHAYATNMNIVVASNVGLGRMDRVTHIRADLRMDNIERRENKAPPVWTTVTLA